MPPPHLHPRSRMTSSLFATTVAVSFFVVALPHILPCPAPRVTYADAPPRGTNPDVIVVERVNEDGTITTTTRQRTRRRKAAPPPPETTTTATTEVKDGIASFAAGSNDNAAAKRVEETGRTRDRECPVPKPGGVLGELLSYVNGSKNAELPSSTTHAASTSGSREAQTSSISRPTPEPRSDT
ncbi:uncharacterized protein B0I36DRAFT_360934 [Microdochium trichocladiopsis]|uniref:Alpha-1,3-mannosyltransferase n=1 Tax=Microdochium trichocladiopsis TaxID=1682393 RepID=A0A9P9BR61_9PEZI|nr:uncharacterized protein B0I36DRAFT_360934 [Microdochium trichocladiopsis]KAH7035593.1 hypothetical protein B0I36DRAFT_360934 [Microdochium trichocladiopsis]